MSLSFFYPLCWLGALAVAAPIWLHLRRRSESRVIAFSALRFLDDQPQPAASPLRLRNPLLLVLRLLGLLLVVAAFAWPFVPSERTILSSESHVLILDSTLSHRAAGRWEAARDKLIASLRAAPLTTQVAVIELRATPRIIADWNLSRAEAIAEVEKLEPTHQRGSYAAAFRLAESLLGRSLGQEHKITLLSDSQQNQWTEESQSVAFLSPAQVDLPAVTDTALPNIAIFAPRIQRIFLGDRMRVECTVRLARQGALNETELTVNVPGQYTNKRLVKFPEDEQLLQLELAWEAPPTASVRGELSLTAEGDSLAEDNRVFLGLPPVRPGQVLLLARSPYLRAALSPDVMQGRWLTEIRDEPPWKREENTEADESLADALVIESHYLAAKEARELTFEYIRRGRGVLVLLDQINPSVLGFLREFGMESRSLAEQPKEAANLQYVHADHPIFRPFRSPDFGNLLDIRFSRYRRMVSGDAIPLAFSQQGDPLLMQLSRGSATLLFAAFGLERGDTNWPLEASFVPFLDLCLNQIRGREELPSDVLPGESCVWTISEPASELVLNRLTLPRDDSGSALNETNDWYTTEAIAVVRAGIEEGRVEFAAPDTPGLYAVSLDGGKTTNHYLQVNPAIDESILNFEAGDEFLAAWRLPREVTARERQASATEAFALTRAEVMRQTVWWWLLATGTLALVAESWWLALPGIRRNRS